VPPTFKAIQLSGYLKVVRDLLFGETVDRAWLNWRLQELLTCVHSTELAQFVYSLDPRVTYWPFNDSFLNAFSIGAIVSSLIGSDPLYVTCSERRANSRLYFQWHISVLDGSNVSISDLEAGTTTIEPYMAVGNLSIPIPLPNSPAQCYVTPTVGDAWSVAMLLRPDRSLGQLINDVEASLTDQDSIALFDRGGNEPYKTFGNLWRYHPQLPYRAAGLVLALGYRINDLRT
jgi:hypothetical protein